MPSTGCRNTESKGIGPAAYDRVGKCDAASKCFACFSDEGLEARVLFVCRPLVRQSNQEGLSFPASVYCKIMCYRDDTII